MAQEYYNLERVAEILKLSTGEVKRMQEQGQLRAFRDGSNWKFRKEDVEEALANMIKKRNQQTEAEEEDVLTFGLAEEEAEELPTLMADSNLSDTDDGLSLADGDDDDSSLGISLEEEDSGLGVGSDLDETIPHNLTPTYGVAAELEPQVEEDDLVLGGNDDVIFNGEEDVALELDEDSDILALTTEQDNQSEVPTLLVDDGEGAGNEFDLIADAEDTEDSESSSQVIALDDETPFGAEEMPDFGAGAFDSTGSDFGASSDDFGPATSSADAMPFTSASPKAAPGRSPYEATYSGKTIVALGLLCVAPVGLAGLMVFDLVRFIGSWNQSAVLSSPIMNVIANILGWK